jgi:hypothetical protein
VSVSYMNAFHTSTEQLAGVLKKVNPKVTVIYHYVTFTPANATDQERAVKEIKNYGYNAPGGSKQTARTDPEYEHTARSDTTPQPICGPTPTTRDLKGPTWSPLPAVAGEISEPQGLWRVRRPPG